MAIVSIVGKENLAFVKPEDKVLSMENPAQYIFDYGNFNNKALLNPNHYLTKCHSRSRG